MGMLNGVRQINRIIAGTDDSSALQTNLGTAANYGSFAQALALRSQVAAIANSPAAATAVRGAPLAESLFVASDHALNVVAPLGSGGRPHLMTSLLRAAKGAFVASSAFPSIATYGNPHVASPTAVGKAWWTLAGNPSYATTYASVDGGNTWTELTSFAGFMTRINEANGFGFLSANSNGNVGVSNLYRYVEGAAGPVFVLDTSDSNALSNVAFANGVYVVVKADSTAAWSSSNGTSWTSRTGVNVGFSPTVCYCAGAGVFVARGSGTTGATSPDGITWTTRPGQVDISSSPPQIVANSTLFVMCRTANSSISTVHTSPDGFTWTARALPSTKARGPLNYNNGMFFFMPYGTVNSFTWSFDGITWYETYFRKMPAVTTYYYGYSAARGEIIGIHNSAMTQVFIA